MNQAKGFSSARAGYLI